MKNMMVILSFVIAELIGTVIFYNTRDTVKRMMLTCLGLGFAAAVVILDIIPDATEDYLSGYWLCAVGFIAMLIIGMFTKRMGNYSAVVGIAIHNFAEGIIISTVFGPISPVLAVGAVLHKLPEGIVSFSLLDRIKDRTRFLIASLIALLIPVGAVFPVSESITKPVMAVSAGVILFVVGKSLIMIISKYFRPAMIGETEISIVKLGSVALTGAVIGWMSCLLA